MATPDNVFLPKGSSICYYKFMFKRVIYRGSTGKRDQREAKKYVRTVKESIKREALLSPVQSGKDMTVKDVFSKYLDSLAERKGSCDHPEVKYAERSFGKILDWIGPNMLMSDVSMDTMRTVVSLRRKEPKRDPEGKPRMQIDPKTGLEEPKSLSGSTVNRTTLNIARRAYMMARDELRVPVQPIKWGKLWVKENGPRTREIKIDEEEKIQAHPAYREGYGDCFDFGIMSALRRSNLVNLTWEQVDLVNRLIKVTQKGRRVHTVEIDSDMMEILIRQLDKNSKYVFTFVAQRTYYNPRANRTFKKGERYPLTVAGFTSWLKRIAKDLDLDICVHDLRRTGGTRMLRETGNLKAVQMLLGHANIKLTSEHYAHVKLGDMTPLQERTHAGTRRRRRELAVIRSGRDRSMPERASDDKEQMSDVRKALVRLIEDEADSDLISKMLSVAGMQSRASSMDAIVRE